MERVLALAPDSGSASAGQGLGVARKWEGLGRSGRAVWGLCQGSGKNPYQVRVDLSEPAFKCGCPSRKFPCKHGLGLLVLLAKDAGAFEEAEEPGWVSEWLDQRSERSEKKAARSSGDGGGVVDEAARAKRIAERGARVQDGVLGCRVWLEDVVRRGLAAVRGEGASGWDRMAARMVDAQAPGLASGLRRVPGLIASGTGWEVRTLDHLGRLHLLLRAGERLESLPEDLGVDVRTALGWNQSKDEVLLGAGVSDRWMVLGQVEEDEDRVRARRTWLVGRGTGRRGLVVDFAAGRAAFEGALAAGMAFDGELVFYPGRLAQRALVKSRGGALEFDGDVGDAGDGTIEEGLRGYAEALGANPWVARWVMVLVGVRVAREGDDWFLVDGMGSGLALSEPFAGGALLWRLLSASGGRAATVLCEWDGERALPLSAMGAGWFVDLGGRVGT